MNQDQQDGVAISAPALMRAQQRRMDSLNQENTMLLARTFDLEEQLGKLREQYTQLLAVCPDDVVTKARDAAEKSAESPNGMPG